MKEKNKHAELGTRTKQVASKLELSTSAKINVFKFLKLDKYWGETFKHRPSLPKLDEEGKIMMKYEAFFKEHTRKLMTQEVKEFLIIWKNLAKDGTWEANTILENFPKLKAFEDKAFQLRGGWEQRCDLHIATHVFFIIDRTKG